MAESKSKKLNIGPAQELKVLRSVLEITNSEMDLKLILREVVKVVSDMIKGDSVFIYLLDEKKRHLVLQASKTPHNKELGRVHLKLGEGITGWVASQNKTVAISAKAYQDKRFKGFDILPEDRYEAFLSVPVMNKKRRVGVINVQHKKPHEYSARTVSLISLIAKQVGGVIANAELYEQAKTKAIQFDHLVKVSRSIASEDYLDEILNLIVIVTAEMLNSKICSIMLLDERRGELSVRATCGVNGSLSSRPNLKVNGSLSGEVVRTRRPAAVYDVRTERRYRLKQWANAEGLSSMLCVPMAVKDRTIGLINVYTKSPHHFIKEEVDVLQMVANQAAVSIENTKLLEDAFKAREALESRKVVDKAKSALMRSYDLDSDTAYSLIHKKAMDSRKPMKEIAESILLVSEL